MTTVLRLTGLIIFLWVTTLGVPAATASAEALDARLSPLVDRVALDTGQAPNELRAWLAQAEIRQEIIDAISDPAEALPWHRYRQIFLNEQRIDAGVAFWDEHQATLERAEREFGVPAAIITAIIGVETLYGTHTGRHRVLDALLTLGLEYPPRADFFLSELEHFLRLVAEEGVDPLKTRGSYAGAMGMPQFIPSSYRAYAVDFSDSGQRDLLGDAADAIGSVGNYLAAHGWERDRPVAVRARHAGAVPQRYRGDDPTPRFRLSDLGWVGMYPKTELAPDTEVAVIELDGADGREYWLGLRNFYAITRYNHSPLYAMAVHQLAEAITARRGARSAGIDE